MRSQENRKARPTPLKEGEEVPAAALQTRTSRKTCGDLPGRLQPPRLPPAPGHAGLPGKGPQERGVPGSGVGVRELPGPREERLLPNPPAQAAASKAFPLVPLPVPPLALPLCFFRGGVRWQQPPPSNRRDAYTRRNLAPASPRHS